MRKKYRNDLFNLIGQIGFNQDDFSLIEENVEGLPATTIGYLNSPFKFTIRNSTASFESFDYKFVQFGPGYETTAYIPEEGFVEFGDVSKALENWLLFDVKAYLEESNEPDLWTEFKMGNKTLNINAVDFNDKSSFSPDEKKQIVMSINELKFLIQKDLNISDQEQSLVLERLDYLIAASNRLNKFDWKSLAISTLLSISIALSLDTEKGKHLFELFKKVFSALPSLIQN